jgi:hypothetical protein
VVSFIVLAGMAVLAVGGYVIYKYRLRVCIQSALLFVVYDDSCSICKILATLFYDTRNCIGIDRVPTTFFAILVVHFEVCVGGCNLIVKCLSGGTSHFRGFS